MTVGGEIWVTIDSLLFLSESRRNRARPITLWTWSKVVRTLALRADVPRFSTHTPRHLCLTDLARAGWELHAIAGFAGHRNVATTLQNSRRSLPRAWSTSTPGAARPSRRSSRARHEAPARGGSVALAARESANDPEPPWAWPVDVTRYDRSPQLTTSETRALRHIGDGVRDWPSPGRHQPAWRPWPAWSAPWPPSAGWSSVRAGASRAARMPRSWPSCGSALTGARPTGPGRRRPGSPSSARPNAPSAPSIRPGSIARSGIT